MKIRSDFVTNSSSVSYIVTLNLAMAEFSRKKNKNFCDQPSKERIYDLLVDDLKTKGKAIEVNGADVVVGTYDFEKKTDCLYDSTVGEEGKKIDFSSLTDEQVWAYVYGEYFVKARLAAELKGFGAVQVPRDKEKFAIKAAALNPCEVCGKCQKGKVADDAHTQT
ncbi:MAG: hypothetical protein P4K80_08080 [Acidobacteriaceae bacterium]|nr:hypothetical protein [Acidobacteriaceae bacterium]